jgi:hypothetical protein
MQKDKSTARNYSEHLSAMPFLKILFSFIQESIGNYSHH